VPYFTITHIASLNSSFLFFISSSLSLSLSADDDEDDDDDDEGVVTSPLNYSFYS